MNAQQLFLVAVAVAVVGVCGRKLNFVALPEGFENSVFRNQFETAQAGLYGEPSGVAVSGSSESTSTAFVSFTGAFGTSPDFFSKARFALTGDDNLSFVNLTASNFATSNGPGRVSFASIGTGSAENNGTTGGSSEAGFDVFASGISSSDTNATVGSTIDAFLIATEGYSSSETTVCVGATCV